MPWSSLFADAGYRGLEKHKRTKDKTVLVAMRPGKRKQLPKNSILSQIEYLKSQIRVKIEQRFIALVHFLTKKATLSRFIQECSNAICHVWVDRLM